MMFKTKNGTSFQSNEEVEFSQLNNKIVCQLLIRSDGRPGKKSARFAEGTGFTYSEAYINLLDNIPFVIQYLEDNYKPVDNPTDKK